MVLPNSQEHQVLDSQDFQDSQVSVVHSQVCICSFESLGENGSNRLVQLTNGFILQDFQDSQVSVVHNQVLLEAHNSVLHQVGDI